MKKITITTSSFAEHGDKPLTLLRDAGYEAVLNPYKRKLTKEEAIEFSKDAIGIVAGTETIDASVMESLLGLKVISRCGAGMDNVDSEAAKALGIEVFNTPDAPTLAVAEMTVCLILALLRKIPEMDRDIRAGVWKKKMGNLLLAKRVGILGFGRIGRKVAELLAPFGCEITYFDICHEASEAERLKAKSLSRDELLRTSDVVTVHACSAEMLIGADELKMMKDNAWLVNASRGGVVDEEALYKALKGGELAGAALDVFTEEPYNGPLSELDNVILTPHVGSYAAEGRVAMETEAVENLLEGLALIGD